MWQAILRFFGRGKTNVDPDPLPETKKVYRESNLCDAILLQKKTRVQMDAEVHEKARHNPYVTRPINRPVSNKHIPPTSSSTASDGHINNLIDSAPRSYTPGLTEVCRRSFPDESTFQSNSHSTNHSSRVHCSGSDSRDGGGDSGSDSGCGDSGGGGGGD